MLLKECVADTELEAFTYVRGYMQFTFDGGLLNVYSLPSVSGEQGVLFLGELGYFDAICECVGAQVIRVDEIEGVHIAIVFNSGSSIVIPLDKSLRVCAEAAIFQAKDSTKWVTW